MSKPDFDSLAYEVDITWDEDELVNYDPIANFGRECWNAALNEAATIARHHRSHRDKYHPETSCAELIFEDIESLKEPVK